MLTEKGSNSRSLISVIELRNSSLWCASMREIRSGRYFSSASIFKEPFPFKIYYYLSLISLKILNILGHAFSIALKSSIISSISFSQSYLLLYSISINHSQKLNATFLAFIFKSSFLIYILKPLPTFCINRK